MKCIYKVGKKKFLQIGISSGCKMYCKIWEGGVYEVDNGPNDKTYCRWDKSEMRVHYSELVSSCKGGDKDG